MKVFDVVASWINKLDTKIFGGDGHQPLAGNGFVLALKVAVGVGFAVFVVQMATEGKTAQEWVVGIGGVAILAAMIMTVLPSLKALKSIGAKIGYVVFCLVLAGIALQLAMWIVMLILAVIVLYIVLYFLGGSSGRSSKKGWVTIKHADGSTEERKTESGPTGEKRVTDKYGNTWDVPYGKNYLEVNP